MAVAATLVAMPSSAPRSVWYASYGSNCSRERFQAYLSGGRAPGARRVHAGARDPRPPAADAAVEFASAICFTGRSRTWGGAPCFLEHQLAEGPGALGRRYLITEQQFADVMAQENGRPFDEIVLPSLDDLEPGSMTVVGAGNYDALVALPPVDGAPVVTFTAPVPPETRTPSAPAAGYLSTLLRGLRETHSIDDRELAERMLRSTGMTPTWTLEEVLALLA